MKRMKLFFATIVMLMCCIVINAQEFEISGIRYNITSMSDLTVEVIDNYTNPYSGNVNIPESVTYESQTYNVTSIGEQAFYNCTELKSVIIPNSIISIGEQAFYKCKKLTSVIIPNSVTSIGDKAFAYCGERLTSVTILDGVISIGERAFSRCNLKSVTIPNSVTEIGNGAFEYNSSLTSCTIGSGVIKIGSLPFYSCSALTDIVVDAGNKVYDSRNNCNALIETESNILIQGSNSTSIIPEGVTSIAESAFKGLKGLKSITIPGSIEYIGQYAFSGCEFSYIDILDIASWCNVKLDNDAAYNPLSYTKTLLVNGKRVKDLVIPDYIEKINDNVFGYCEFLTSVVIPNSVKSIGDGAFAGCSGIDTVTIGNSVASIGANAFFNCTELKSVNILDLASWCRIDFDGQSLLSNRPHLYLNGKEIKDLVIPDSIVEIKDYAFKSSCLTSITIHDKVIRIGESAFGDCGELKSVTLGNSVKTIGEFAFADCGELKSVTLGNSVETIKMYAFRNCNAINEIFCYPADPPYLNGPTTIFEGLNKDCCTLYVPCGSVENYKRKGTWQEFNIQEMESSNVGGVTFNPTVNGKVNVYSIEGTLIKTNADANRLSNDLPKGIYIINDKKFYVK